MAKLSTLEDFLREIEDTPTEIEDRPCRELAFLLVDLRKALGITQAELARRTAVSRAYISRLESGLANPSIKALATLLRGVGAELQLSAVLGASAGATNPRVLDRRTSA
jgi:DNA-binding XRE family transcriptional regulator